MKRDIGLIGLTFVAVGGIVGSGWLFAPLLTAQLAGPAALIAWVLGAMAMLLLALTFAEVSGMLPVSGGIARVPQFSHGNLVAMVMGWTAWAGYNTAAPIEVQAMLTYLAPYASWLHVSGADSALTPAGMVAAGAMLVLFVIINAYGVRFFAYVNSTITWAKVGIPLLTAAILLSSSFEPANFHEAPGGFSPYGWPGILAAISTGGVIFSLIGFRHAIDLAGETRNPRFTVPAALILSLLICVLIYGSLQFAFIGAIPSTELSQGWHTLQLGHDLGPLGALASAAGILWLVSLLNTSAVISPFGGGLVAVGSNARLALAMSRNGFFPRLLQKVSPRGVPVSALILNLIVSAAVLVFVPFQEEVALNSAAIVLSFAVGPITVVALRRLMPHANRGFSLPWPWLSANAAFIVTTLVIYWTGWHTILRLSWVLLLGAALFAVRYYTTTDKAPLHARHALWILPYLVGIGLISWLGNFGGGREILPFGWDLLACALLSVVVFYLAVRSALPQDEFDANLRAAEDEEGVQTGHRASPASP